MDRRFVTDVLVSPSSLIAFPGDEPFHSDDSNLLGPVRPQEFASYIYSHATLQRSQPRWSNPNWYSYYGPPAGSAAFKNQTFLPPKMGPHTAMQ